MWPLILGGGAIIGGGTLLYDKHKTDARKEVLEGKLPAEGYKTNLWQKIHGLNDQQLVQDKTKLMLSNALDNEGLQQRAELLGWADGGESRIQELLTKDAEDGIYSINSGTEAAQRLLNSTREQGEAAQLLRDQKSAQGRKDVFGSVENQEANRRKTAAADRKTQAGITAFNQNVTLQTLADSRNQTNLQFQNAAADRKLQLQLEQFRQQDRREERRYNASRDDRKDKLAMMAALMGGLSNSARMLY